MVNKYEVGAALGISEGRCNELIERMKKITDNQDVSGGIARIRQIPMNEAEMSWALFMYGFVVCRAEMVGQMQRESRRIFGALESGELNLPIRLSGD